MCAAIYKSTEKEEDSSAILVQVGTDAGLKRCSTFSEKIEKLRGNNTRALISFSEFRYVMTNATIPQSEQIASIAIFGGSEQPMIFYLNANLSEICCHYSEFNLHKLVTRERILLPLFLNLPFLGCITSSGFGYRGFNDQPDGSEGVIQYR